MSYLRDIKESLKNIDDLCSKALKESDDCEFYIREISSHAEDVLDNFEHLISELKIGEEKLKEATKLLKNTLTERIKKMTQQFKFGDRVIDTALGLGECVVINVSENSVYVMNERGDYNTVAQPETLEIIPHPDTVRLDWLVKNDCALTEKLCDEDGDIHPTPNAVIQKQEDHFEVLAATSNNIREAIDVAMAYIDSKR